MICFFLFKWDDALHRSTCRVLKAPVSMTLTPGRIEWSFRLSVAVWPLCPSVERRYVCDNTGLYRCGDGCLWSRSWQRRREIKKGRRQGWTTRWPLDYRKGKHLLYWVQCPLRAASAVTWGTFYRLLQIQLEECLYWILTAFYCLPDCRNVLHLRAC